MKMPLTVSVKGKCQMPVPFFSVFIWTESIMQTSKNYFGNWDWEHEDGYVKVKTLDTRKDNLNDYIEVYQYDNTRSI